MQTIVELALECPFELRIGQVSRMDIEVVHVNRDAGIFESDDYFDRIVFLASVECEQRVFIEPQVSKDAFEILLWSGFGQSSLRNSLVVPV
jgi:hypothetical protein